MHTVDKPADPIRVAKSTVLIAFPINDQHTSTDIALDVVDKVVGLCYWVAATGIVVVAELFAQRLSQLHLVVALRVDVARALCSLNDDCLRVAVLDDTVR